MKYLEYYLRNDLLKSFARHLLHGYVPYLTDALFTFLFLLCGSPVFAAS